MPEKLHIGVIGCGEISVQTAKGIAAAANAEHTMVMDVSEQVAADLGRTYGVPHTTAVEDLLANPAVEAVYIAVPHHLHAPLTLRVLAAGKHVLVEKPIATTLGDADAMIAAAHEAGVTLSVAYHAQVDDSCRRLQALIAGGAIGKVVGTRIVARADKPASYWRGGFTGRVQTDWRTSKAQSGGGVLIMNTVHDLNTMRFITGLEARRVYCECDTYATAVEVEDYVAVTYRYDNGAIGTLEAGSAIRGKDPFGAHNRIYGEAGQILLGKAPRIYVTGEVAGLPAGAWQELPGPSGAVDGSRRAMVEGFAGAVLAGQVPPVRGEDGRAALEIVVAAYRSGQEQQPVLLPV